MILFFSGSSTPIPERYLHEPAIMLTYYEHVRNNRPCKRFRDILTYRKNKAKAKKGKAS